MDSAELHPPHRARWPRHRQNPAVPVSAPPPAPRPYAPAGDRHPDLAERGGRTKIPRLWGPQPPPDLLTSGWWPLPRPELAGWRQRSRHRDSRTASRSACPARCRSRCGDPRTPGGSEEAQWEGPWLRRDVLGKLGLPLIRLSPQVSRALVSADFCRKYLEERKVLQGLAGGVGGVSWSSARMSSLSQFL